MKLSLGGGGCKGMPGVGHGTGGFAGELPRSCGWRLTTGPASG